MGRFFPDKVANRPREKKKIKTILIISIVIVLFVLFVAFLKIKANQKPVYNLKSQLILEINSAKPEINDYFVLKEHLSNKSIDLDDNSLDISKVGSYIVNIKINGKVEEVTVEVEDTTEPDMETQELTIDVGSSYLPSDFIKSCVDNSGEDCIINYSTEFVDENGNALQYDNFTELGEYEIIIQACDQSENCTKSKITKLTIQDPNSSETPSEDPEEPAKTEEPNINETCTYGTNGYDASYYSFPLAVAVYDKTTNCAINRDLWDDEKVQEPVNDLFNKDYKILHEELDSKLNNVKIVVYPSYKVILNKDNKGLVGYGIYIKVYIQANGLSEAIDSDKNLKLEYYLKEDGTRSYIKNEYKLQ